MSKVLDHCESGGRRHIRFRELAADILGSFILFISVFVNMEVLEGLCERFIC